MPAAESNTSRRKTAIALASLSFFGICVALAVGEIAIRATWQASPSHPRPQKVAHPRLKTIPLNAWILSTPRVEGNFMGGYFRNNSLGFRDPEIGRFAAKGVFRVAVIGDSVTMGSGVANREAYPALLAARLEAGLPGRKFESLNLGLSGLNTTLIFRRLRQLWPKAHSHLIVYGVTLNDLEGPKYREMREPTGYWAERERYGRHDNSRSYLLRFVWPRLQSLSELINPSDGTYLAELQYNYFENRAAWETFEKALRAINDFGKARGAPVVVFLHTTLDYLNWFHPYHPMYERITAAATALDMPVISSFESHVGRRAETLWVSGVDPHPNAEGHRILAATLSEGLLALPKRYLAPAPPPPAFKGRFKAPLRSVPPAKAPDGGGQGPGVGDHRKRGGTGGMRLHGRPVAQNAGANQQLILANNPSLMRGLSCLQRRLD